MLSFRTDFLLFAKQRAFESNLKKIRLEQLQKKVTTSRILALSFLGMSALFSGIVAYEYHTTKPLYEEFKVAARTGDKNNYDRTMPVIKRANIAVISCTVAASASSLTGIYFTWKIRTYGKQIHNLKD